MSSPRLSIVTPTRNAPHLLDRLFYSLVNQTCPDFEYVLVDTSSDDLTMERWWRDFAPHLDHRFRYARIHLPSPNMADAFEYAFSQAKGEYVCPMTHKAMWRPDGVENLHRVIDRYPELPCFAFKSLYTDYDIHQGSFADLEPIEFGSPWDGSGPEVFDSREIFVKSVAAFSDHGYEPDYTDLHLTMPFSSHAVFRAELLARVKERFGAIVAGRFAGDSRLGYRIMDLEAHVHLFRDFEPRISSMLARTGAAGAQLNDWRYLSTVFSTLSVETKQVISRSPFGYMPLWAVLTTWELFSNVNEAQGHLRMTLEFPVDKIKAMLVREISRLTNVNETLQAGLLRHVEAIAARLEPHGLRAWF